MKRIAKLLTVTVSASLIGVVLVLAADFEARWTGPSDQGYLKYNLSSDGTELWRLHSSGVTSLNHHVTGTLGVDGVVTFSGAIEITGAQTNTGALVVNGASTLGDAAGDTVTLNGNVLATNSVQISEGGLTINAGGASVTGAVTAANAVTVDGTLSVNGAAVDGDGVTAVTDMSDVEADTLTLTTNQVVHGRFEILGGTNLVYIDSSRAPAITNTIDADTSIQP